MSAKRSRISTIITILLFLAAAAAIVIFISKKIARKKKLQSEMDADLLDSEDETPAGDAE